MQSFVNICWISSLNIIPHDIFWQKLHFPSIFNGKLQYLIHLFFAYNKNFLSIYYLFFDIIFTFINVCIFCSLNIVILLSFLQKHCDEHNERCNMKCMRKTRKYTLSKKQKKSFSGNLPLKDSPFSFFLYILMSAVLSKTILNLRTSASAISNLW